MGGRCTELSEKLNPVMSLLKIALFLESEDSNTSYMDFPKSGMMRSGNVYGGSFLGLQQRRERIYIIAYSNSKYSERQRDRQVFREPYLPGELPRVYPGWKERRDLPEPRTFRSTDGLPDLVDRNKCVGNAVQPLMAQYLFECIKCFDQ